MARKAGPSSCAMLIPTVLLYCRRGCQLGQHCFCRVAAAAATLHGRQQQAACALAARWLTLHPPNLPHSTIPPHHSRCSSSQGRDVRWWRVEGRQLAGARCIHTFRVRGCMLMLPASQSNKPETLFGQGKGMHVVAAAVGRPSPGFVCT